ncbi:MAG: glutathione S-transferase [Cypionkella sp.]|uniref:glutathione S-transferase family protein n=1 Tax=Cypionkella sp. TaxID=2811411 RepID=UPI002613A908|nr:glutathione S-transferase family protein [Cypionkella sp.]MDB5658182.1 glutathione S-transferase [Cypionkella sp.]
MAAILYYSRNPNPRLAVAVAKHLNSDVTFEFAQPFHPDHRDKFRALNPSLRIPILLENGHSLWEADAIACRLSMQAGSNFWRLDDEMPEMIRWISWGKAYFVQACDVVHFERGTKQRYGLGPIDQAVVAQGLADFREHARQLDAHLIDRDCLLDSGLSYADFRMASYLAFKMWQVCRCQISRRLPRGMSGLPR